jgi:hypothetical protein
MSKAIASLSFMIPTETPLSQVISPTEHDPHQKDLLTPFLSQASNKIMQSKVKTTVDSIMLALGPIFHEVKDYETIRLAMVVVMSKVIQATPERGKELQLFDITSNDILHALEQLLKIEETERAKLKSTIAAGIDAFDSLGESDSIGPALVAIEKAAEEHLTLGAQKPALMPSPEEINDMQGNIKEEARIERVCQEQGLRRDYPEEAQEDNKES